jgi:peptide/nickel transport system substrate-binding protein
VTRALAATLFAALILVPAAGTQGIREGGTFRVSVNAGGGAPFTIDPALAFGPLATGLLRPSCGTLMAYPNKPLPAGLRLAPELAEKEPVTAKDLKTYTFTIRKDARFSTGAPVTARDLAHSLERILDPSMESIYAVDFRDIVGAREMLAGKAKNLRGVVARGRTLTLKLTRPLADLPARTTEVCAVPANLPADPEGARAPLPSAAPYYVSEYVASERLLLERNRFYRGSRPRHVDRIEVDLAADNGTITDLVASGKVQYAPGGPWMAGHERELVRRYGVNRSQFFVLPALETHMFMLNTSRPLFRNNVGLRRAVNFAVNRTDLVATEIGPIVESPTDQLLPPTLPGFRDAHIYPLARPNLRRARALAKGNTRGGKAVLYTCTEVFCVAPAQILQQNLKKIGLDVRINKFPLPVLFQKLATPGEPFDIARVWLVSAAYNDPAAFISIFDGRSIGEPGSRNFSYFDSPAYNRLIDRASRFSGNSRYRAYADLDVKLARDAAPAIPYANFNELTFVSANAGCIVLNPALDLTAVCLK